MNGGIVFRTLQSLQNQANGWIRLSEVTGRLEPGGVSRLTILPAGVDDEGNEVGVLGKRFTEIRRRVPANQGVRVKEEGFDTMGC